MAESENGFPAAYVRGLQTSVRNNSSAYGFSVMITASLAVLQSLVASPKVGQLFLFLIGAVAAMVLVELVASKGFTERMRGEPPEVVALGSAFSLLSVSLAVGTAALTGEIVDTGAAWPLGSFLATLAYLVVVAVEMALAETVGPAGEGAEDADEG